MCEIFLIYWLQKQIGETYERGGRDSTLIRVLFVISWIVAEIFCIGVGLVVTGELAIGYLFGVVGIVGVCVVFFVIANTVPPKKRERGYMDYYQEYRETGNVRLVRPRRRPRRDPEDDDDDRPRRRRDEDEEDDPPRRRPSSREEDEDDRPRRRSEGIRRDEDDDEPRRRRPRDEDEDY